MTVLFDIAPIALICTAMLLTVIANCKNARLRILGYIGGMLWAIGVIGALINGAGLEEILISALIILLTSYCGKKRGASEK